MNTKTFTIDFFHAKTNTPLFTVRGALATWLAEYSALIRNLRNIEESKKGITIHVDLPTDRVLILRKLLRGEPLGVGLVKEPNYYNAMYGAKWYDSVRWYPLGPLEEAEILTYLQTQLKRNPTENEVNEERKQVILLTLQYLMVDREVEDSLIVVDELQNALTNHQRKRIWLNENTIEDYIEQHKNYLYSHYGVNHKKRGNLEMMMTRKNIANRNTRQKAFNDAKEEAMLRKRSMSRRRYRSRYSENSNYNSNYNNSRWNEGPYNRVNLLMELNQSIPYHTMTSLEFERYIRSLRGKKEKNIPYQGEFDLQNLYGKSTTI